MGGGGVQYMCETLKPKQLILNIIQECNYQMNMIKMFFFRHLALCRPTVWQLETSDKHNSKMNPLSKK